MEIDPRDIGFEGGQVIGDDSQELAQNTYDTVSASDSDSSDNSTVASHNNIKSDNTLPYHVEKWERSKKYYNDQYLDLLKDTYKDVTLAEDPQDLLESHIGAAKWTSDEKKLLFAAVGKHGRHNLPQLQHAIVTKSPIEIAAYLNALHAAYIDRQKFMRNAKNVSLIDIPAAIEIGIECETALEKAADALIAYQEQYDITAGQKEKGSAWLIDRNITAILDDKYENTSSDIGSSPQMNDDSEEIRQQVTGNDRPLTHHLFRLPTMLDLSELFFMNHSDQSLLSCWQKIAEPGQRPAMTEESVQTMLGLTLDFLRRVLKLSIQIANARISSMSTSGYSASQKLGQSDVAAALDILNLPHDSWDYWARLARRNSFQIITGSHSKGETRSRIISYDQAEALLTNRRGRGRRRSMSIGSETSSAASDPVTDAGSLPGFDTGLSNDIESDGSDEASDSVNSEASHVADGLEDAEELGSSVAEVANEPSFETRISREERRLHLDEASDQYANGLDLVDRAREENRIWHVLGKRPRADIDAEDDDAKHELGPRPKTLRKTNDELQGWSCTYMGEWELREHPIDGGEVAAEDLRRAGSQPLRHSEDARSN